MTYEARAGEPLPPPLRDLSALVEFATVARWQHMTRAAEELGMAQPTLSRRIARLEQALALPLFTRHGRRIELTRTGRALATAVERAIADLEHGLVEVARSADPESGTVALAFLNTLGVAVVPRLLQRFRADHPAVGFQLVQDGHDAVVRRLRAGEVDVCLTSPPPEGPDLVVLPLHHQPLRLVVAEDHPLARRHSIDLAEVAREQFVGFKEGYGMRRITEEWCRRAGFVPRLAFEGEDVATVRGLVSAGLGVALLPETAHHERTVELTLDDLDASRTIGLVWAAERPLPAPARTFRDFIRTHGADLTAAAARES